jgi:hypothetical protein
MLKKFETLEEAKKVEKRIKGVCVPNIMLNWFLSYTHECLPDDDVINALEEIQYIASLSDLSGITGVGFGVNITVDADDDRNPHEVTICVSGERAQVRFIAKLIACFLGARWGLILKDTSQHATTTVMKLEREDEMESEAYYKLMRDSLLKYFGTKHVMMKEILDKPKFWNSIINVTSEWSDVQRYKYPKIYE